MFWEGWFKVIGYGVCIELLLVEVLKIGLSVEFFVWEYCDLNDFNGCNFGDNVVVMVDDYGKDLIVGKLVFFFD